MSHDIIWHYLAVFVIFVLNTYCAHGCVVWPSPVIMFLSFGIVVLSCNGVSMQL